MHNYTLEEFLLRSRWVQSGVAEEPARVWNNESFIQADTSASSSWVAQACVALHSLLVTLKKPESSNSFQIWAPLCLCTLCALSFHYYSFYHIREIPAEITQNASAAQVSPSWDALFQTNLVQQNQNLVVTIHVVPAPRRTDCKHTASICHQDGQESRVDFFFNFACSWVSLGKLCVVV